jgi:hypothetical protein
MELKTFSFPLSLLAVIRACADVAGAETLRTNNFEIKITRHCGEGSVSCDRVTYVGKELGTNRSITLTGRTMNRERSYTFIGYKFCNGKYTYLVTADNYLQVYQGDQLIIREQGTLIED